MAASFNDDKFLRALGANIRWQRLAHGLTHERPAEQAEIDPQTVQRIEVGNIAKLLTTLVPIRAAVGRNW